jgi:multidrug resistance efflux pump
VEPLLRDHIRKSKELEEIEKPRIKSNRKKIESKLSRLNELYVDGIISREKYKQDYADLQSQIIDDQEEEKIDLTAAQNFLSVDFKSIYDTLSRTEKQSLWRSIIKELRISNDRSIEIEFL